MKFKDIPKLPKAYYRVQIPWNSLEENLERYGSCNTILDMNPDFQRGYVWSKQQKIDYIEFCLRGGESGREIYFNHPNWMTTFEGTMVIVDGKQRIDAVLSFMHNKIPAYGHYLSEYEDRLQSTDCAYLNFNIAKLQTKEDVLRWYIGLNTGGTVHTEEEIQHVKKMIRRFK